MTLIALLPMCENELALRIGPPLRWVRAAHDLAGRAQLASFYHLARRAPNEFVCCLLFARIVCLFVRAFVLCSFCLN